MHLTQVIKSKIRRSFEKLKNVKITLHRKHPDKNKTSPPVLFPNFIRTEMNDAREI